MRWQERRQVGVRDASPSEQTPPHPLALRPREAVVAQEHGDPRAEGVVEGRDAVGGEEQHPPVVLQQAQEDGRHGRARRVALRRPLLHVDVRLV
jgi:hypothetical protein